MPSALPGFDVIIYNLIFAFKILFEIFRKNLFLVGDAFAFLVAVLAGKSYVDRDEPDDLAGCRFAGSCTTWLLPPDARHTQPSFRAFIGYHVRSKKSYSQVISLAVHGEKEGQNLNCIVTCADKKKRPRTTICGNENVL